MLMLMLAALVGCEAVDNPTGDCDKGDGGRACYHSPEATDAYIPVCDGRVERELWRVFAQASGAAYMIPRPDAAGVEHGICDGDDAELAEVFERSGLCEPTADPDVVNNMELSDAIAVSVALHERLFFTAVDDGDGAGWISPWAPDDDMAAVCDAYGDELGEACDLFAPAADGECLDVGYVLTLEEATRFAEKLNLLYGVEGR